ncbi:MAG: hypothetical protein LBQ70_02840 [Prevotellaceae bacterium]|jgi:hypothetical protein|nr:hypothetical protein [Prevotellaceae bacterium]
MKIFVPTNHPGRLMRTNILSVIMICRTGLFFRPARGFGCLPCETGLRPYDASEKNCPEKKFLYN